MPDINPHEPDASPHARLTALATKSELQPWVRAKRQAGCLLYWLPVSVFPAPAEQRKWILSFIQNLSKLVTQKFGLRPELFIQDETLKSHLREAFLGASMELRPLVGFSRRPDAPLPPLSRGESPAGADPGRPDPSRPSFPRCYWIRGRAIEKNLDALFGYSGTTLIFLKPDPKTKPPEFNLPKMMTEHPLAKGIDLKAKVANAFVSLDCFLPKSKEVFGKGVESHTLFRAIPFILPQLNSSDFFSHKEDEVAQWFDLFDVYLSESADDRGLLLASRLDFEHYLVELLAQMREDGLNYPER
ncbi:MAG: hypothetical protein ACRD22_18375 [Terriglobia bacterium]